MCDVFEIAQSAELDKPRERLWDLIDRTPNLDWLLLTKRPENIPALAPRAWVGGWPANILALATAENQAVCENRVGALCAVPASVTGLSLEPLLGPVDLSLARLPSGSSCHPLRVQPGHYPISGNVCRISWLIIGCEKMACNRPGRPCELLWVRDLIRQARATAGVKVFVKQLEVDGRVSADPADWPEDLRIQEFPQ
jgi:protein gp37